jgi:AraC family transcriptional regulator
MSLLDHGIRKFPVAKVKTSSAELGWKGIAAEVRSHPSCELPLFTSSNTEITIALRGKRGGIVARSAGGARQIACVDPGTIWITPHGIDEEATRITKPLSDIAHIYLPQEAFSRLAEEGYGSGIERSVDYVADARDDLIRQISASLVCEMRAPTAGGKVLAETLSLALAARILQRFSSSCPVRVPQASAVVFSAGDARMQRVVDYMMAHLEDPIGLADLAAVACLSSFHFARTFRSRIGEPPHRFLGGLRLERAKFLLAHTDRSIVDISLACQFSSQTNFTRAFRKFAGATPKEYRTRV